MAELVAAAPQSPLLEGRGLGKTYARVAVLNSVNFALAPGEILALVGENGAGKSTLIKILSGAIQADPGGEVLIDGKTVTVHSPEDADRNGIVTVYQEFSLFPDLSITENLFFGEFAHRIRPIAWGKLHRRAEELLARWDPLESTCRHASLSIL